MQLKRLRPTIILGVIPIIILSFLTSGCRRGAASGKKKELISFRQLNGIDYTEVYRRMKNGLSFNEYGYQLEPQWKLRFVSDDSVSIYSPDKNKFLNFPLSRGYDSIFNAARAWLKVKQMNEDSLVFELLKFQNDSIDVSGAKVFMTFYANKYITDVLHTNSATLRHPSRKDTVFIRSLVAKANSNPHKAFAAREPAELISKSALATAVQRRTEPDMLNNFDTSDDYLDPVFDITIHKAKQNFYYSFSVVVDQYGKMTFGQPLVGFQDDSYEQDYIKASTAIVNSYLTYYFNVIPGSTLNMPHTSVISVHVKGIAGK